MTAFRRLLLVLLFAAPLVGARAQSGLIEFDQANRAYTEGDYEKAIAAYNAITEHQGYSAAVLFNLGNAYFKDGQVGNAILNYERALLLDPGDPDILTNLQFAREESGLPQPATRWWQSTLGAMTPGAWAWAASALLLTLIIICFLRWFVPGVKGPVMAWRALQTLLALGVFLSVAAAALTTQHRLTAIVVKPDAQVLASPFEQADTVDVLHEGRSVDVDKIDKQFGDYLRVRYDRDKLGWVKRESVVPVNPTLLEGA